MAGFTLGRIFGAPLVVSWAWVVLVVIGTLIGPSAIRQAVDVSEPASYVVTLAVILLIYAAVLAHEAGHVLVAKAFGLRVRRVVLQLLGAVSEVIDEPQTPGREFLLAAVGPLTSVFIAGVAVAVGAQLPEHSIGWLLVNATAAINALVAAFNLLPGMPLDGGRLLRAVLWRLTGDRMHGLLVAGQVGRGIAGLMAVAAILVPNVVRGDTAIEQFYLLLIAAFIWFNASLSIAQARVGALIPQLSLAALVRPALTVEAQLPLAEAVRRAREIGARALVVVDGRDRWSGIVSEAAVKATPVERQPWMSVSDLARPVEAGLVLSPTLNGADLMTAVQETPATEYLVAGEDGALKGVLARTDLIAALRAAGVR